MKKPSANISNSSWNLANILLYPVIFLALTPYFIDKLGETDFGIWMLINSYVYIAVHIVSFGMGNSITAHLAEALGKNSRKSLFTYLHISTRTIAIISLVTIAVAIIWYMISRLGLHFFKGRVDEVLIIATLVISVKFWELFYQSFLKGYERYDLAAIYNILNKLLVLGAQLYLVYFGYGIYQIFISNLIINVVTVFIQAVVSYRLCPGYRFRMDTGKDERRNLFHFGFWTWLQTIVSVLAYQIDRFVVALFLGPAITGYYILASTMINHMHLAFGAIVSWLLPKISRMKETNANIKLYFTSLRSLSIGFGLLSIFVTSIFYEPVFRWWLGADKFEKVNEFFRLFLLFEAFMLLTIVPLFYLNAVKKLRFITAMELMYKSGVIIGLFVAFAIAHTGNSIIIGQILALVILLPLEYFFINRKVLKDNPAGESFVTILPSILISLGILFNTWYINLMFFALAAIVFGLYFLNKKRFNLSLLRQ